MFLQLLANGLVSGAVIAIAAVGVSLVYEILRIVNFAHGDYLAFGTFVCVAANVRYEDRMLVAVSDYAFREESTTAAVVHSRKSGEVENLAAGTASRWTNVSDNPAHIIIVSFR